MRRKSTLYPFRVLFDYRRGRKCFQIPLFQEVCKLVEDCPSINLHALDQDLGYQWHLITWFLFEIETTVFLNKYIISQRLTLFAHSSHFSAPFTPL